MDGCRREVRLGRGRMKGQETNEVEEKPKEEGLKKEQQRAGGAS